MNPLDLLRVLGWELISFIFSLIDSLFEIIKELNSFDIVDSMAEIPIFKNFHSSIITIAITLFGLFVVWTFVKKVMDPDEGLTFSQTIKEILKCGAFIILSTFLFSQVTSFSISLSGFVSNIFKENNTELSDSMLNLYVDYTDGYLKSDNPVVDKDKLYKSVSDGSFSEEEMFNDKYVKSGLLKKGYVYKINWIMAVIIGGFFLYALFFSGMMLARRQIEFLFLFVISPIVFATSIGNRQRRSAVIEQLVSLTLQAAVVVLIINITALIMQAVNNTTFFNNVFQDMVIKSLMFIGCGSFLLTGSQVVNRFIGGNVSANSGREQMMSLMSFGQSLSTVGKTAGLTVGGAGMLGVGSIAKGIGDYDNIKNKTMSSIGNKLSGVGRVISKVSNTGSSMNNVGNYLSNYGGNLESIAKRKLNPKNEEGLPIPTKQNRLSRFGGNMMNRGKDSIESAFDSIVPNRNLYRRRSRYREIE